MFCLLIGGFPNARSVKEAQSCAPGGAVMRSDQAGGEIKKAPAELKIDLFAPIPFVFPQGVKAASYSHDSWKSMSPVLSDLHFIRENPHEKLLGDLISTF